MKTMTMVVKPNYQGIIEGIKSQRFDEKTQASLGYYVYMLINPEDDKPFYIGKGGGKEWGNNRVFDHLLFALTNPDATSDKCNMVRRIVDNGKEVKHIIVSHGMQNEIDAYRVEAALIDTLNYCGCNLTNEVNGHHAAESGLMTTDEIKRLYSADELNQIEPDCMIININNQQTRSLILMRYNHCFPSFKIHIRNLSIHFGLHLYINSWKMYLI